MQTNLDLLSPESLADPGFATEKLQHGDRVHLYNDFDRPFHIVHRYEDVEAVLRDAGTFVSGQGQGPNFIEPTGVVSDPPNHTFYRALVQDAFQPAAIAELEPRLAEIAGEALESVEDKMQWDLHDTLAFPLPIRMICEILGIPAKEIWQFKAWSDAAVAALASDGTTSPESGQNAMAEYVLGIIEERRRNPNESLISRIANARRDGQPIPDAEALSLTTQMFVAGNETTTSLITNFVWRLSKLGLWQDFVDEKFDLDLAINESLRFDPPLLALFRTTAKEATIGDQVIPAGTKVMTHYAAANRDPAAFDNPNDFIPERRGNRILSFGLGIHSCLGKELAKLEARIALDALRKTYPQLKVLGDGERIPPFLFWGRCKLPVTHL